MVLLFPLFHWWSSTHEIKSWWCLLVFRTSLIERFRNLIETVRDFYWFKMCILVFKVVRNCPNSFWWFWCTSGHAKRTYWVTVVLNDKQKIQTFWWNLMETITGIHAFLFLFTSLLSHDNCVNWSESDNNIYFGPKKALIFHRPDLGICEGRRGNHLLLLPRTG